MSNTLIIRAVIKDFMVWQRQNEIYFDEQSKKYKPANNYGLFEESWDEEELARKYINERDELNHFA